MLNLQDEAAVNSQVDRLLKDLGNPEPPLRLEYVRELLRLDLKFYSSTDIGWLQEQVHALRVAGRQVLARPTLLLDVVRKLSLKALVIPDRKRILMDQELPPPKQRWSEAHEIAHTLLPWHGGASFGDRVRMLSPACHRAIEGEANYAAGRLLFLGAHFEEQVRAGPVNLERVKALSKAFGNSLTTTLWRVVEHLEGPGFGLVSIHPHAFPEPTESAVRYFVRSRRFARQFPGVTDSFIFDQLSRIVHRHGRGPLGGGEVILVDSDGTEHIFWLEAFCNSYDTLTLGTHRMVRTVAIAT